MRVILGCYLALRSHMYRSSGELGVELGYCGLNGRHVVVAGHRDSMVAIQHEVGILKLVKLDRRQVLALWNARSMRFHLCPTLALAGRKDRSKSLHRPTLPTISSISTTLVPR